MIKLFIKEMALVVVAFAVYTMCKDYGISSRYSGLILVTIAGLSAAGFTTAVVCVSALAAFSAKYLASVSDVQLAFSDNLAFAILCTLVTFIFVPVAIIMGADKVETKKLFAGAFLAVEALAVGLTLGLGSWNPAIVCGTILLVMFIIALIWSLWFE